MYGNNAWKLYYAIHHHHIFPYITIHHLALPAFRFACCWALTIVTVSLLNRNLYHLLHKQNPYCAKPPKLKGEKWCHSYGCWWRSILALCDLSFGKWHLRMTRAHNLMCSDITYTGQGDVQGRQFCNWWRPSWSKRLTCQLLPSYVFARELIAPLHVFLFVLGPKT